MNGQRVSEFMSRRTREHRNLDNERMSIVAYPQNDARELAKIMTDIRIDCLPVMFSPWNKKVVGFIELSKISVFLNE